MDLDLSVLFNVATPPTVLVLGLGESGFAIARWCARHGAVLHLADSRAVPPNLDAALALPGGPHRFVSRAGGMPPVGAHVADGVAHAADQAKHAADAVAHAADGAEHAADAMEHAGNRASSASEPFPLSALDAGIDLVAISPGLSPLDPPVAALLDEARRRGVPVWGELTFFSRALQALAAIGRPSQVIAITGTNGKTTTTALTGQLVARAGRTVAVAGNISPAMLDRLGDALDADALPQVWVLELSSFQLETAQAFAPDVAAVLNVSQDHLDWHGGYEAYAAAKFRVFGDDTRAVLNRQDAHCLAWQARDGDAHRVLTFGTDAPARAGDFGLQRDGGLVWLAQAMSADGEADAFDGAVDGAVDRARADAAVPARRRGRRAARADDVAEVQIKALMPVDALRIRGLHNASNALAALALCRGIGLPLAPLLHGLREYRGEPHRVETVAVLNGVDYVDDSKATNVGATVAALDGLASPIWLIAGGVGKDQDFTPLAPAVARWCKAVLLIGRDAPLLRAALADCQVPLIDEPDLQAAVSTAAAAAQAGETVLLSPACASFDMFRNYGHRAEVFRRCVEALAAEQGVMI